LPGAASIEFIVSPAAPLAVDDAAFDLVTCQQGLQFFPDRPAAIREMHRALKPGGRVAVAVWREIGFQPYFAAIDTGLRECLPEHQAEPYGLPFRWPKASDLATAFSDEGFTDVSLAEVRRSLTFEGGLRQAFAAVAASPVATTVAGLDAAARARLWSAVQRRLAPLVIAGQVRTQMVSNIVTARKSH
jgi:SAM-dependent methyltransferase